MALAMFPTLCFQLGLTGEPSVTGSGFFCTAAIWLGPSPRSITTLTSFKYFFPRLLLPIILALQVLFPDAEALSWRADADLGESPTAPRCLQPSVITGR